MNEWPYDVASYNPKDVQEFCVQDPIWQRFRKKLKGIPTTAKLVELAAYKRGHEALGTWDRRRQVQIANYINALKRGGQLGMDLKVQK